MPHRHRLVVLHRSTPLDRKAVASVNGGGQKHPAKNKRTEITLPGLPASRGTTCTGLEGEKKTPTPKPLRSSICIRHCVLRSAAKGQRRKQKGKGLTWEDDAASRGPRKGRRRTAGNPILHHTYFKVFYFTVLFCRLQTKLSS